MELEDGNYTTLFQAAQRTTLPQSTDTFLASKIHFICLSAGPSSLLNFRLYPACRLSAHFKRYLN